MKDLNYWKNNAEEDYLHTPISVLKYIAELEENNKTEKSVDFAIWLQDNYSQNVRQGESKPLPKGYMREDFTNNTFPISEIYKIYKSK